MDWLFNKTNELLKEILGVEKKILHEIRPHTSTLVLQFKTGDNTMADLVLQVGQTSILTMFPGLADGVTVTPGATLSNHAVSFTDPSASVVQNPDGTFTFTGVSATTADVTGIASATATDSDGVVTNVTKTFTVSVTTVTTVNRTSTLILSFSAPTTPTAPTGATPAGFVGRTPAPGVATK